MADTTTTVTQAARRASDAVGGNLGRLRDDLETADQRVRQMLHQYPLAALFAAIASGYLIGRLASRR